MPSLPERLGRYRIEGLLGEGGMGSVHRARDEELGRDVAIKVMQSSADPAARARFKREARAACALHHPNVATIFDVGESDGAPYIVMELVRGDGLRSFVGDTTPRADKVRWLIDVGAALQAAHDAGFIHRDMKPENVVIGRDGVAKILDFGIAKAIADVDPTASTEASNEPVLTRTGATIGTPAYMSPEQIRGEEIDPRADQFAWGVTVFEVLTGQLPWARSHGALALAASILTEPPKLDAGGLPPAIVDVIGRCVAKRPEDRFTSMKDACAALRAAVASDASGEQVIVESKDRSEAVFAKTTEAPAPTPASSASAVEPKRGPPVLAVAGALAIVALGAAWLFRGSPGADTSSLGTSASAPASASGPASAPSASPSTSAAPSPDAAPLPSRCRPGSPLEKRCTGSLAWCDATEGYVACCAAGLSADARGRCVCPPGGTTKEAHVAQGCKPGTNDLESVRRSIDATRPEIEACYDAALKRNPKLGGKLSTRFEIGPDGHASFVDLVDVAVPDPDFQDCVRDAIVKLRFAPPADGSLGIVYPWGFEVAE